MNGLLSTTTGRILLVALALVIGFVAWAGASSATAIREQQRDLALRIAASYIDQVVVTRRWVSEHAGVYVVSGLNVQPNPYLPESERTLQAVDGTELVLVNPAYFVRLTHEMLGEGSGISVRAVGIDPVNPESRVDDWERTVIDSFDSPDDRAHIVSSASGVSAFRYVAPLVTEESCLECHDGPDDVAGGIQGALSLSMSYAPFADNAEALVRRSWTRFGLLGLFAVALTLGLGTSILGTESRLRSSNEALERANAVLADQSAAKTQFLATMSHELRTPLNSIIGFSGILAMGMAGTLSAEQRKQVGIINSAGKHLLALINDILDLSKVETGRIVLVAEEFDPVEVLDSVVEIVRPLAEERGLELRVSSPEEGDVIYSDRRRIEQVLINLVANAIKHTDSGFVALSVDLKPDFVDFIVEDTGSGIAAHDVDSLFEEFHQVAADSRQPKGTGLGLMISRKLAALLSGEILVSSEPGCGSLFTFRLARRLPDAPPLAE